MTIDEQVTESAALSDAEAYRLGLETLRAIALGETSASAGERIEAATRLVRFGLTGML